MPTAICALAPFWTTRRSPAIAPNTIASFRPPARHGGPIFWHQDNAYWQCVPAHHERSAASDALLDGGDQIDESRAVCVDLPAGGVTFHHCQTFHYTKANTTDRQRRAFAIHLMPPGTRSKRIGDILSVSFSRPMLRMRM